MKPKHVLPLLAAFAVGLYATWRTATWLVWWQAGLDRDTAVGSPDCDQCELTVLLDHIGVVIACFAAYLILVGTSWLVWRRRHSRNGPRAEASG